MRTLLASIALACSLAASPAAAAQPGVEEFSVAISFGDLDVGSDLGVNSLLHRVKARADQFCVGVGDSPLQQLMQVQKCRANFIQAAEQKMQIAEAPTGAIRLAGR